jgi:hypothetical protein
MNSDYVRNVRYKLQTQISELNLASDQNSFYFSLKRFLGYVLKNSIMNEIVNGLAATFPDVEQEVNNLPPDQRGIYGLSVVEQAALGYVVESDPQKIVELSFRYHRSFETSELLNSFRLEFLNPFYNYLDAQLHDQEFPLSFLLHYRQKCEWFQRKALFNQWDEGKAIGETILKRHLLEYLHDQGFNILVEPASPSGEVDLIAAYSNDKPIILEAKVFSEGEKSKPHIITGFKQLYTYVEDYQAPSGVLLIYKTCDYDLSVNVAHHRQTIPCVIYNNKLLLLIVVDIFPHEKSASQRGRLKAIEITENDLIQILETNENSN